MERQDDFQDFFYSIKFYSGKIENFKMTIDTDTFLDLWLETRKRCHSLQPLTPEQYQAGSAGRVVLTYPVSKLTKNEAHKATTYECYEPAVYPVSGKTFWQIL